MVQPKRVNQLVRNQCDEVPVAQCSEGSVIDVNPRRRDLSLSVNLLVCIPGRRTGALLKLRVRPEVDRDRERLAHWSVRLSDPHSSIRRQCRVDEFHRCDDPIGLLRLERPANVYCRRGFPTHRI